MIQKKKKTASRKAPAIPADDPRRTLMFARPDDGGELATLGLVGCTSTILVGGHHTRGQHCLIDMFVPPGGGTIPHRHDFEETFTLLEGVVECRFREQKHVLRAGETVHIPANAPHHFRNSSGRPARMLCFCSPAGQDDFFRDVGIPLADRTAPAPRLSPEAQAELQKKTEALAPKYRTELLPEP
jgi:quercetin dioxygenase-like cupin family protein